MQNKTKQNKTKQNKNFHRIAFILISILLTSNGSQSQIVIKDSIAITPTLLLPEKEMQSSPAQTCYNIIYELNATAVKTPRPRIIFITDARTDTLVYCTSVFNCGVSGLFDNSTYPIGPVTTLYGRLDITYKEGANASGTVVSYPAVEIRPTTTHRFDVKTLEVILHYDPVYYVPADIVFGYVHFRIAPVTPPTISITFPGEDTTIVVTDEYLPTIVLKETHTPADAVVTWTPSNSIAAADHITPLVSEATVTVNATATRECGGEQTVARKITFRKNNVNKSPLITKINYTPNRRYFAYNDIVTVTAEATDPDGDAVSIKYEPEQEFILNQIGEFIVKITAIDSKGATTVKEDKIYAVGVTITPSKGIVKDGDNIDFQVDIYPKSISASSFEWSWEPENPNGGNNPFVNFIPDNAHQSVIVSNAKWYADPDRECPPCSQTSSYNLGAILYIGGDKFETKGKMGVFLPVPGGKTIHDLRIVGEPDFVPVFDKKGNILRYKVDGISKMKRIDNPTVKIFVSGNSRFYDKVLAHENVHKEELLTGVGKDIASLDKLYKKIKNLTANSFIEIRREYFSILNEFILNESKLGEDLLGNEEIAAYTVSDPIAPKYFYQRCSRTKHDF